MAVYRSITTTFWTDSKVLEDFSVEDRLLYIYLLTNNHCRISGCYEVTFKTISFETGLSVQKIKNTIEALDKKHHVIKYDHNTNEVLLLNWGKYQWTKSPKVIEAIRKDLPYIHNEQFVQKIEELLCLIESDDNGIHTLSIGYFELTDRVSIPSSTVTVTDTVYKNNKKSKSNKPSLEDIKEYCAERKNKVDPEQFYDFYEANGWVQSKNKPIVDWKACVRTWEKREKPVARSGTINKFNNFGQREYNDDIEKLLLKRG